LVLSKTFRLLNITCILNLNHFFFEKDGNIIKRKIQKEIQIKRGVKVSSTVRNKELEINLKKTRQEATPVC